MPACNPNRMRRQLARAKSPLKCSIHPLLIVGIPSHTQINIAIWSDGWRAVAIAVKDTPDPIRVWRGTLYWWRALRRRVPAKNPLLVPFAPTYSVLPSRLRPVPTHRSEINLAVTGGGWSKHVIATPLVSIRTNPLLVVFSALARSHSSKPKKITPFVSAANGVLIYTWSGTRAIVRNRPMDIEANLHGVPGRRSPDCHVIYVPPRQDSTGGFRRPRGDDGRKLVPNSRVVDLKVVERCI